MTTVVTDRFRALLYASLDKTVPIDPATNLMVGKSVHWVFFRSYAAFTGANDPRYTAVQTIANLVAIPGWSAALTPSSTTQAVGTTTAGTVTYCIANNPFAMGGGWAPSTVVAAALVLEGTQSGTVDPVILITDTPFQDVVLDPADTLIARPASVIAGNRPLFSWPVFITGQTTTVVSEGSIAVLEAPPAYELAYTRHAWLYPQRVNFIANPSFELGTNHWRTSGAMTRVQGTAGVPAAPGGGAWFGRFTGAGLVVAESNVFSMMTYTTVGDMWTIQAMVRGTGQLRVGLLSWEPEVTGTLSDWGDSEVWDLPANGFLHLYALRHSAEGTSGLVRFECSGGTFEVDNVLIEPDWLKDWQYFDGDSTYGARDDFAWYGGENRKGQTYSTWYNHKRAVTGRLFAWDIDSEDFVITDEEVEAQGFVYKWVPAGVRVTPHLDVLYPNDIQEAVSNNASTPVTAYKTNANDSLGVVNPWAAGQYLSLGAGTATTPDTANMTIAGRVRLTVSVRIDTVTAGQFPPIVGKYPTKREYMIYAFGATNGLVSMSTMQPDNTNTVDWIIRQPFPYGERHTYGSEFTPGNSGVVVIYDDTRASLTAGSLPTPPNTADPVTVGFASYITGRLYWAQLETLDGAGNVTGLVWRFDPTEYPGTGTVFTDPRGRVWTLTSAAAISRS